MKNLIMILFLPVIIILCDCKEPQKLDTINPLEGLWKLNIMEQKDTTTGQWREWRSGMQGYLLYDDDGHMALHMTIKGYENTDLSFPNFVETIPVEALRHLTGSYVYFARYKVSRMDSIIEHSRISHSNPADWNKVVRRKYFFSGDTLILRPVENQNSGLRLKWLKSD